MKTTIARLALTVALMAGTAGVATAGDWNNGAGSLKDRGGMVAVPVPAPAPVPIYESKWYFRADFGIATGRDGGFSEDGMLFGMYDSPGTTGPEPFGNNSSWFDPKFDTFLTWGGGVGYKWSDRVRTDVTIEGRSAASGRIDGETSYVKHEYDPCCGTYGPIVDPVTGAAQTQVNIYTSDHTSLRGGFAMFNAYWDFSKTHGFTPYVGAGLGVAFNRLTRHHNTRVTECSLTTVPACDVEGETANYSATSTHHNMTLAAALMAGLAYDVNEYTTVDVNYRFLHIEGTSAMTQIINERGDVLNSRVTFGDTQEHQIRAGLRFNVF